MNRRTPLFLVVFLLISSCSFFSNDEEQGVLSLEGMDSTTTTIVTPEERSWTDSELLLAQCIRDNNLSLIHI